MKLHTVPSRPASGISLIGVMMILLIVSLLAAAGARIALMGERGARNDRDYQLAWQAGETALMDAEFDMRGPGISPRSYLFTAGNLMAFSADCGAAAAGIGKGLCLGGETVNAPWLTADMAGEASPAVSFGDFTGGAFDAGAGGLRPAKKPRYLIEAMPDPRLFSDRDARVDR